MKPSERFLLKILTGLIGISALYFIYCSYDQHRVRSAATYRHEINSLTPQQAVSSIDLASVEAYKHKLMKIENPHPEKDGPPTTAPVDKVSSVSKGSNEKKVPPDLLSSPPPSPTRAPVLAPRTASMPSESSRGSVKESRDEIARQIEESLNSFSGADFSGIQNDWKSHYGPDAADALMKIAKNRLRSERDRYISLLSAVRLGGTPLLKQNARLSHDRSPFIRLGYAIACQLLRGDAEISVVYPLLHDPALVVRQSAVKALRGHQDQESQKELISVLSDYRNYSNHHRAFPIIYEGIRVLGEMNSKNFVTILCDLYTRYPAFRSFVTGLSPADKFGIPELKTWDQRQCQLTDKTT